MKHSKIATFLNLAAAALLGGCSLSNKVDPVASQPAAGVAFLHAAPSAPNVDVILDNATISTTAFTYSKFSGYLAVTPGTRDLRFSSVGDRSTVVDTTLTVLQDASYTFVLYNKSASKTKSFVIKDEPVTFTSTNGIMVRFLHVSPDTPAVKVVIAGQTTSLGDDIDYTESSGFIEYPGQNTLTVEVHSLVDDHIIISKNFDAMSAHQYFTVALIGYQTPPANNNNKLTLQVISNS